MTKMTKTQARKAIVAAGMTEHYNTGSCGDKGFGSRLYFKAPDAPLNQHGVPVSKHGTISNLGREGWVVSVF